MNNKLIIFLVVAIGIVTILTIIYHNSQIASKNSSANLFESLISKIIKLYNPGPRHLSINPSESVKVSSNP